jgi:GNAT superfamily N-acetyltransferase
VTTDRPATVEDADELARLLALLGHPTTASEIRDRWDAWAAEGNVALVAERAAARGVAGGVVGAVTLHRMRVLHRPRPVGRFTALVVDEAERGRGIGRALMAAAEATLGDAGCGLLELTSNLRLTAAHAFYERLGYERTGVRLARFSEHGRTDRRG